MNWKMSPSSASKRGMESNVVSNATLYSLLQTVHVNQTQIIIPTLTKLGVQIMALVDDVMTLTNMVSTLQDTVTTVASEMDTLLADLNTALANSGTAVDPAVQAAVDKLTTLNGTLQAAVTRDAPPAGA